MLRTMTTFNQIFFELVLALCFCPHKQKFRLSSLIYGTHQCFVCMNTIVRTWLGYFPRQTMVTKVLVLRWWMRMFACSWHLAKKKRKWHTRAPKWSNQYFSILCVSNAEKRALSCQLLRWWHSHTLWFDYIDACVCCYYHSSRANRKNNRQCLLNDVVFHRLIEYLSLLLTHTNKWHQRLENKRFLHRL